MKLKFVLASCTLLALVGIIVARKGTFSVSAADNTQATGSRAVAKALPPLPEPLATREKSQWQPLPLVSQAQIDAGFSGGEGAQWPRAVAVDGSGQFLIFGSDVGGLFRSLDGGDNWEPCNVGYSPRGTSGVAIDPHNSDRVLSIGANSVASEFHGVWLSIDRAASWHQVLPAKISGSADDREQLAFDPNSYDTNAKMTRTVYWSRIEDDNAKWGETEVHPALYKSDDGGATWRELPDTQTLGGSRLKVHPTKHIIYAANPRGLWRSSDAGATWTKTQDGDILGLDVSPAEPDSVWACLKDGVYQSTDSGATWKLLAGSKPLATGAPLRNIHVSPVDSRRLIVWRQGENYQWPRFWSHDGGASWQQSKVDSNHAFLPQNARQALWAWHPKNANIAWSTGGDWPTKSTDGGQTWKYAGNGYNVILVGGGFNFNQQNPNIVFVGSQDYNGAVTRDGGKTWSYYDVSGKGWGGFDYGAYAANASTFFVGDSNGWGDKRRLRISLDGGKTWTNTEHFFAGPDVSFGDPKNPQILFASNLRSTDGGQNWTSMSDCEAVYNGDSAGVLYGRATVKNVEGKARNVVRSSDGGATWQIVASAPDGIDDIAVDAKNQRVYIVSDGACKYLQNSKWQEFENLPKDQWGGVRVRSIALDPTNADIIYLATNRDLFASNASALRSLDGGKTWQNLTRQKPLDGVEKDGGREAHWVRVHPQTREAWFATSCYGIWKIAAPK